ncbi:hypothetical protein GGR08_000119 [Bartonella fuyuanensis]|uniref:Uncharacterized protein n=1 Tax=Bartonella fuyuanensis TaxID=1460968 RepID=A0A840E0V7_9HYPH|nr:hypothetical protein [Bartonella fuyuanensis]
MLFKYFKNALDNLAYNTFLKKLIGLLFHKSSVKNVHKRMNIYVVVRTLYGYALQCQIVSTKEDNDTF